MMEAPFTSEATPEKRRDLLRRMNKLVLADVVENLTIEETIRESNNRMMRHYEITVSLVHAWQYAEKTAVTASQVSQELSNDVLILK